MNEKTAIKLHPYPKSAAQAGWQAEALCRARFERAGYIVSASKGCDLRAISPDGELLKIEVKGARQAIDGRWHFTLRKEGKTDISKSDIVFLVQFHRSGVLAFYLIPVAVFKASRQACIGVASYAYEGKYKPFMLEGDR